MQKPLISTTCSVALDSTLHLVTVEKKFSAFFEKWIGLLKGFLRYYVKVSGENSQRLDYGVLVNKLTAHHKEYYTYKWVSAHEDVLAFFTPVWLSLVEKANLWITVWKPSMAFRLIESLRNGSINNNGTCTLGGMSEDQVKKIEALRVRIKLDEEKVERELERQQISMADRKIVELAAIQGKNGGGDGQVEVALKGLLSGLEKVMKMADFVRLKTLKGMVDTLTPMQCVDFLAAMSNVLIQMRKWGRNRDYNNNKKKIMLSN